MRTQYIDFISAYCDRWCERCAFTSRCSAFAAEAAIAMCGDVREGLELAVARPHPARPDGQRPEPPAWLATLETVRMTPAEEAEFERAERERKTRIESTSIMHVGWAYTMVAYRWLKERAHRAPDGDEVLKEALAIVLHDSVLITVKLSRALDGFDRYQHDGDGERDPVQNDWNGTAKVALISIERSEAAWRVIAQATGDDTPALLADQLRDLRREVDATFPNARSFVRPGFDEQTR